MCIRDRSCIELFDEKVNFVVIPAGMTLHYGDAVLNEELLKKEGDSIYVYGNLKVPEDVKLDTLDELISKLIVKDTVVLMKNQETSFKRLNVEYQRLEFEWEGRIIENKPNISIDKILLENSSDQVLVRNIATVKIAQDVTPESVSYTHLPETQINDKFSFDSIDSGFDLCNYLADQYTAAIKRKSIRPNKE